VKAAELKARGNDFFRDGHYDRAVQSYTAAIKLLPDDAEKDRCVLLSNAGAAYYELGFFKQAYSMSLNATKIDPGYWKAHFRCAQALIKMDSKTEAKEHINQLLQSADPNGKEAGEKLSKEVL
jgi:DnaJ family protein C protein 7